MESSFLTEVLLPLALAFIMTGMGLSLSVEDFKRVVIFPKAVGLGLINQLLFLPVLGFLLCSVFSLDGTLAVGLMILAACPGGATSNLIAHLSKGDTALSITLTAISSLITIITIPFIVNFALGTFMGEQADLQLPVGRTIAQVFVITILPVSIGMFIKNKFPAFAQNSDKAVKALSAIFLALIIVAAILKERNNIVAFFIQIGPATLALNLGSMALGYFSALLFKLHLKQRITIAIESGIQNGTLGILVAATLLKNPEMSIPPAIYSLVMFGTAFVIIALVQKVKFEA